MDIREYYDQKIFGPLVLSYEAKPEKVDEILAETVCPEKYAYTDFEKIEDVKIGDVLNAGKRFILMNEKEDYAYSKKTNINLPWEKKVNGSKAYKFTRETLRFFDDYPTDGIYIFQTQQTPNLGTEIGITSPLKLAGDFMTDSYMKSSLIISLNLDKGIVVENKEKEFAEGLKWN